MCGVHPRVVDTWNEHSGGASGLLFVVSVINTKATSSFIAKSMRVHASEARRFARIVKDSAGAARSHAAPPELTRLTQRERARGRPCLYSSPPTHGAGLQREPG